MSKPIDAMLHSVVTSKPQSIGSIHKTQEDLRALFANSQFDTNSSATSSVDDAKEALPQISGYKIHRFLGSGSMGTVYEATHTRLNRTVALKIIHPGGHDQWAVYERFTREVRSLARIEHPNIVSVYDAGIWQGFPYYAMKYIAGGTLDKRRIRLRQDRNAAVGLMVKVARAVQALHAENVLHRDLKPQNILMDGESEPYVTDFGLAYWIGDDNDLSVTGSPLGTRQYMPPEQTLGNKTMYSPASDIWSLGVILFELLTGQRPFQHEKEALLFRSIRFDDPPSFAKLDPTLPKELEAICRKCLDKRPESRYPNAGALADDLERWLTGAKVEAPRPRNRLSNRCFRAVALGVIAAIGATLGVVYGMRAPTVQQEVAIANVNATDLLKAGKTAELLGEKGAPKYETFTVPSCVGSACVNDDGLFAMSSAGILVTEFTNDAIPSPFRVELEYCSIKQPNKVVSSIGLSLGRRASYDRTGILYQSIFRAEHSHREIGINNTQCKLKERIDVQLLNWDNRDRFRSTLCLTGEGQETNLERNDTGNRWHKLVAFVDKGVATIHWNAMPGIEPLVSHEDLLTKTRKDIQLNGPMHGDPILGSRIGLYVENAEAVFRNFRVIPIKNN